MWRTPVSMASCRRPKLRVALYPFRAWCADKTSSPTYEVFVSSLLRTPQPLPLEDFDSQTMTNSENWSWMTPPGRTRLHVRHFPRPTVRMIYPRTVYRPHRQPLQPGARMPGAAAHRRRSAQARPRQAFSAARPPRRTASRSCRSAERGPRGDRCAIDLQWLLRGRDWTAEPRRVPDVHPPGRRGEAQAHAGAP
jgi:hypothetical protein